MSAQLAESVKVVCAHCLATNRVPAARLADGPKCGKCSSALLEGRPIALDEARFEAFVGNTQLPVLVDFFATWCAPCRAMAPTFERTAFELRDRALFAKVDIDASPALSGRYGIRSVPTLAVFRGGQEVDRVSGALDGPHLRQWLSQHV
jgi:thioredoxin 2